MKASTGVDHYLQLSTSSHRERQYTALEDSTKLDEFYSKSHLCMAWRNLG